MNLKILFPIILLILSVSLFNCGGTSSEQATETSEDTSTTNNEANPEVSPKENAENEVNTDEESTSNEETETNTEENDLPKDAQIVEGTFGGIEQGDYFYLLVNISDEESISIMVLDTDEFYNNIEAAPEEFEGKKIRVYYQDTTQYLEAAGGDVEISKYLKGEWLD